MYPLLDRIRLLLQISAQHHIARRYFITNGFDGALALLGLTTGFYVSGGVSVHTALSACVGTAVALTMSGLSSAYISESAERKRELQELQTAMLDDLQSSAHARAARLIPLLIAAVNGLAPLLMALVIISPLLLVDLAVALPWPPIASSIALAFLVIFLLGVYIGRVSGGFWLWSALRTLLIAAVTSGLILLLNP